MRFAINQKNIPMIGVLVESLFNALPFLSIMLTGFNFVSIIIVLYANIDEYLLNYFAWMKLEYFVGIVLIVLAVLVVITMIVIYKYVTPSLWTFRNQQMNKYDNEVIKRLKRIEKKLGIEEKLDE